MDRHIEQITSKDNENLKRAVRIRTGRERDLIFIEGLRLSEEAMTSGLIVTEAWLRKDFGKMQREADVVVKLLDSRITTRILDNKLFNKLTDADSPQGICLIAERPNYKDEDGFDVLKSSKIAVLLYQVNNPSNLGAVIRTAEAAGVSALFLTVGSADPYSVKALRAAMGSAFRLPIYQNIDPVSFIKEAKISGVRSFCLSGEANDDITSNGLELPVLAIFGTEAHGLPDEIMHICDQRFYIPMAEKVESLNLAVSVGITLYEVKRWGK